MSIPQPQSNSIALVTGASSGIGEQFARQLAQRGYRVAIVALMARYLPGMVQRRRGAIINMSSTAGFQALPYNAGYSAAKSHVLLLSEAVHAEVEEQGVSVTAVCPGPVRTEFQERSDAGYFAERVPKFTFVPPERVARDALAAADRGRITVIPGPPHVRASFAPNRLMPPWATL